MNAPTPGLRPLRRLHLNSKSTAKVALVVAPGDVLEVSDAVASQLVGQANFDDGDPTFDPTFPQPAQPDEDEHDDDDGEPATAAETQPKPRGRARKD